MVTHRDYEKRVDSTEEERQHVAAAKLAVIDAQAEFFASFGVNVSNTESVEEFRDVVRMMRALKKRPELWQDLDFLHSVRSGSIKAWSRFALSIITLVAGGVVWALVAAIKAWVATLTHNP